MVTQAVVVNGEGALRSKEHGNVGVVGVTDGLAVQSFLDKFSDVPGVLLDVSHIVQFIFLRVLDQWLSFAWRVLLVSINGILRVVGVQGAVIGEQ